MKGLLSIILLTLSINTIQGETMQITIHSNTRPVTFALNHSAAAKALVGQLPLNVEVKNYSDNEKIFYPPHKLPTDGTPLADAVEGTLAYYAPWGNVVIFYKDFGKASGLYELGSVVSGREHIRDISGMVEIRE